MASHASDLYSGDEASDASENYGLDNNVTVLRPGRHPLNLARNSVPNWDPLHAFREYYQNWYVHFPAGQHISNPRSRKDAMIEASQLQVEDLRISVNGFQGKGAKEVYTVEARHHITDDLLGFIRYLNGTVELTNFMAQLPRSTLLIGESTKRHNPNTAGCHGEGFKVASLVMVRNGYRVRYEASNFYWIMKFGEDKHGEGDSLVCSLSSAPDTTIAKAKEKYYTKLANSTPRELHNNVWEDVSVKIGRVNRHGDKISRVEFIKWTEAVLDLNSPSRMIETSQGCVILDDDFKGQIYLKGLLLEGIRSTKPYRFGYNFLYGAVNRDREKLSSPDEQARILARMWADAVKVNEEQALNIYVAMLRDDTDADVEYTYKHITRVTAGQIWEHLCFLNKTRELFYHNSQTGDKVS